MNKRAFTLIELLAIMTLLGIMVMLVLPQIGGSIENRKTTQYNNIITTIKGAAKVYYSENDQTSMVSIDTLIQNDFLSSGLTNPVTGDPIEGCVLIEKDTDGYNAYTYYEDCSDLHEYTMTNLVTNGSFENGSTEWSLSINVSVSSSQKKFGSYSIKNYHSAQWSAAYKAGVEVPEYLISATVNHVYYTSAWLYTVNKGNGVCLNYYNIVYNSTNHWINYQSQDNLNVWEKGSVIFTVPSVATPTLGVAIADINATDALQECYGDGALLIDLTAVFGAGNEPTKEWCDNNINYFDTTKTIWK